MDRSDVILIFQIQRNECIGIFDTIYKIAASLNHALIYQFQERFFYSGNVYIMQEFIPETRVNQVSGSMFGTTYVKIYVLPVLVYFRVDQCFVVTWIHITEIVSGRTGKSGHCIQF